MQQTGRGRRWVARRHRRSAVADRFVAAQAVETLEDRLLLAFHQWDIDEVFSSADGTIQFIELKNPTNDNFEHFLAGQTLTTTANTFTFPSNLPSSATANKTFLMATSGFAALPGAVTPDFVIPDNFFSVTGDTLNFASNTDMFTFTGGQLPLDGETSLLTNLTTATNSPKNFAGASGSINAAPPPPDSFDSIVGRLTDGRVWVAVSDGTSFANELWTTWPAGINWQNTQVGDFTGDGKEDLAARDNEGDWWVWTAGDDRFTAAEWGGRWSTGVTWSDVMTGDFNGDGLLDIAGRAQSGAWYLAESTGSGFTTKFIAGWTTNVTWSDVHVGDFNGDDADDIVGRASSGTWVILQSTNSGGNHSNLVAGAWSTNVTWSDVLVGDFDDDDHDDVIGLASNGSWYVAFSDGSGFTNVFAKAWSTNVTWHDVTLGDFNGDDRTDVAGRSSNGSWYILQPTGGAGSSTTFTTLFAGLWSTNVDWLDVVAGDFDGDGKTDLAGRASSGSWLVARSTGAGFANELWGSWSPAVTWHDVGRIRVS